MSLTNEIYRIAENVVGRTGKPMHGIVSAVDPTNHAVKVRIMPEDIESGWIPVKTIAAGSLRIATVPDMNTHVSVMPIEGDAEQLVVIGCQFDTVVTPPISPATNKAAQPGELLIMAGSGNPPDVGTQSQASSSGAWLHILKDAIFFGMGNVKVKINGEGLYVDGPSLKTNGNIGSESAWTGTITDANGINYVVNDGIIVSGG